MQYKISHCEITAKELLAYLFPCIIDLRATSTDFHRIVFFLGFRHAERDFSKPCIVRGSKPAAVKWLT